MFKDPLISSSSSPATAEPPSDDLPSVDDLFSTCIDVDNLSFNLHTSFYSSNDVSVANRLPTSSSSSRRRHRHINSVDTGFTIMDRSKAMPPQKLSELWNVNPKGAKR